jgi:hypothetical protein
MVQGAVYDAVNAIDRSRQPYLLDVEALDIDPGASYDAAIATAAHDVLVALVPETRVAGLDAAHAATLLAVPDGPGEDAGVAAGAAAAAAMIAARADDGYQAPFTFVPTSGRRPSSGSSLRQPCGTGTSGTCPCLRTWMPSTDPGSSHR